MTTYNLTADGSTPVQGRTPTESRVIIVVTGTFGGGTVDLEYSVDGTNWAGDTSIADIAAAEAHAFRVHPDLQYRATLSGATSPDLDITFLQGRDSY